VYNASNQPGGHLPLACNLTGPEQIRRRGELEGIFEGRLKTDELEEMQLGAFPDR
jgi:hypothetical protein